jgi:hypothetical protein
MSDKMYDHLSEIEKERKNKLFNEACSELDDLEITYKAAQLDRMIYIEPIGVWYSPGSKKWRVAGRATWYNSRGIRYILDKFNYDD